MTKKAMTKTKNSIGIFAFVLSVALFGFACENPSLKANQAAQKQAGENNVSSLERDLQTMRDANFEYVFLFRRKDGGVLDGEDKKYLKANSPAATNRFILTDENKAVMAGSSYKFEPENLEKLGQRFAIENFSKTENQETPKNLNSNK